MAHLDEISSNTGAASIVIASCDLIGELLAQSPKGNPLSPRSRGWPTSRLARRSVSAAAMRTSASPAASAAASTPAAARPRCGWRRGSAAAGRGGGRGGGGADAGGGGRGAAGFGVRVIHSGVWGFASSPIVTEDEIKRITGIAAEVAKASAMAKKVDVKLAPVPAYTEYWSTPMKKEPARVSHGRQAGVRAESGRCGGEDQSVSSVTANVGVNNEWKYFASSEGSYIEQETFEITPSFNVSAKVGDVVKTRNFVGVPKTGGWEVAEESEMLENAERIANEAVEMTSAKPIGMGLKDLVLTPSHAMLTIHEIVAHATELDRILGYEANYAGTSFVKLSDVGKLKYGSKLMNITADRTMPGGMATIGFDDDGVKTTEFPIVRDGILVGLQTNRETAPLIGDKASKGCTSASSWRDYPFLRMPNVHLEAGPKGIAERRADDRGHQGRRAHRRPRQLLDRPAALQRPVRRQLLLGDQERQEDADGDRRHLQRDHDRLLGEPGPDRQPGDVEDVRHRRRRQGSADADQQHLARESPYPDQEDHDRRGLRIMRWRTFIVAGVVAGVGTLADTVAQNDARIRQIGVNRILYGSDSAVGTGRAPREAWASFRELPLADAEFRVIAANVASYLR